MEYLSNLRHQELQENIVIDVKEKIEYNFNKYLGTNS